MNAPWTVLLIGGASENGKTTLAETLGRRFGVPWLQVDDRHLTLQYSVLLTAATHPALFAFLGAETVWHKPLRALCAQLISIGSLLVPAIETVAAHHLNTGKPLILEGDGIIPALFARAAFHDGIATKQLRGAFLATMMAHRRANMAARGERAGTQSSSTLQQASEAMNELYDAWICEEAARYGLPIVQTYPQATLTERIIATLDLG